MLFNGKVTLLTGGSSGIGLEAARQFSAEGARVIITDRNREKLDEAPKLYPASITIRSDALQEEDAKSLLRQVEEKVGIDILCHNAGVLTTPPNLSITNAGHVDDAAYEITVLVRR